MRTALITAALTAAVAAPAEARSLYVANDTSLAQLSVGVPGGLPSPLAPPTVATDPDPEHIAVTSDGRFAYASAAGTGRVDAFRVVDGALTPLGSVDAGLGAHGVVVSPDDRSVYVANQEPGTVSQFNVRSDGTLVAKMPPTVPAGAGASGVAVAPDGRSVYVTNLEAGTVSRYGVDSSGRLVPRAAVRAPARPSGIGVSPDGRSLYVASLSGRLARYDIPRLRRTTSVRVGLGAAGVAITPDGRFLYTPNGGTGTVSQFAVDRRGRLTPLRPVAVRAGERPEGAAVAPNGRALYVVDADGGGVRWFRIRRDGRLRNAGFVPTGVSPHGAVVTPDQGPLAHVQVDRLAGGRVRLDGTGSHDPDGRVVRYEWRFGDGQTATGASVVHRYRRPGRYRVRLVVTDDEGCGVRRMYTGQTMACNGGRAAVAVRWVRATSTETHPAAVRSRNYPPASAPASWNRDLMPSLR